MILEILNVPNKKTSYPTVHIKPHFLESFENSVSDLIIDVIDTNI